MKDDPRLHNAFVLIASSSVFALLLFSGCLSSRSVIEGLAKTPHHRVQDSQPYAALQPYQQDFLYLTETVRETHPEPYAPWSREEFDHEQLRFLESLGKDTSRSNCERCLNAFLSHLKDSHTSAQTSWNAGALQYPVSFFWIKDTLFLASVGREEDTTLIGSQVLSFNGLATEEVFSRFTRFTTYGNAYEARRTLQYYFVFPAFHRDAGVINTDTLELNVVARDGTAQTYRTLPVLQPKRIQHYQSHPITQRVNLPFKYTILKDEHVCYLQWNTMTDLRVSRALSFPMNILIYPVSWVMGFGYFDDALEEMCEEMNENGVRTLIVDLRGNGGGSSMYGDQLLYHLGVPPDIKDYSMAVRFSPLYREFFPDAYREYARNYAERYNGQKLPDSLILTSDFVLKDSSTGGHFQEIMNPKSDYYIKPDRSVFRGNVYFLVGEGTYSSAIILSSLVKDNRLFTTVGQPTRGRPSHYGETLVLKLPHSGIVCRISCKKFFRPDSTKDAEDTLYPDVEIWPTYDDLVSGRDPVFDWVVQDARTKNTSMEQ